MIPKFLSKYIDVLKKLQTLFFYNGINDIFFNQKLFISLVQETLQHSLEEIYLFYFL